MELEIVQVDAFTKNVFGGNSAAVVVLEQWLADEVLQNIALENNLSETVFVVREATGEKSSWAIRWFTPKVEVDLCGHATLAAAYVLFKDGYEKNDGETDSSVNFQSASESLTVIREGDLLQLDFPSRPGSVITSLDPFERALGVNIEAGFQARDSLLILKNQATLEALAPDFQALAKLDTFAVIASAPGDDCDFVSRFFAPAAGILEDPVTGSAHCTLIPYWSQRLNKGTLHARQLSSRGGELFCHDRGDRVIIGGYCCEYLRGKIFIPN